ncbi:peptidase G2 autoproteolytic cleavage domain-containing protein [Antarcticimicrobium luteum]|nr:peptidase G2 autoproteolytic cleavage domain-containing protein [Antarcticimicrobium luteum]
MTMPGFSEWPPIPNRSAPEADFDAKMYALFQHFATTHRAEMLAFLDWLASNSTVIGAALNATTIGLTVPAAAKFTALEAASITGAAVQSTPTDATAGRLLKVGAFGWGTGTPATLDNIDRHDLVNGVYKVDNSVTLGTLPSVTTTISDLVLVLRPAPNQTTQIYFVPNDGVSLVRKSNSTISWGAWRKIGTTGDAMDFGALTATDFALASVAPAILMEDTNAGADEGIWRILANGGVLSLEALNDARTLASPAVKITRTALSRLISSVALFTNNAERVRVDGSGNFGLGTASPVMLMDVQSSTQTLMARLKSTANTSAYMRFDGTGTSFPYIGLLAGIGTFGNTDNNPIRFQTNSLERMRIDGSGNVGIGTTTPASPFDFRTAQTSGWLSRFWSTGATFDSVVQSLIATTAGATSFSFLQAISGGPSGDVEFRLRGDGAIFSDPGTISAGADRAECAEWLPRILAEIMGRDMRGVSVVLEDGYIRPADPGEEPIGVISGTHDSLGNAAPLKWNQKYLKDDLGSYLMEDYEVVEWVETVTETTAETVQATEDVTRTRDVIEIVDGVAVKRTITETVQEPIFDEFPMVDEAGNDLGTHREPRMVEVERETTKEVQHSYAVDALPEGVTVPEDATRTTQQRKVLNPAYDPSIPYTPRLERPEWDAVGVIGICRVLAGQPVGPRWIRMRDVSETVEEWLVR